MFRPQLFFTYSTQPFFRVFVFYHKKAWLFTKNGGMFLTASIIINVLAMTMADSTFEEKRQLLIFGEGTHPKMVQQQVKILEKESEGLKERDLVITKVKAENALAQKYDVAPSAFAVILIGKDGTEKYRTDQLLTTTKLFALVDAMPMRRSEIERKN